MALIARSMTIHSRIGNGLRTIEEQRYVNEDRGRDIEA
jgi:hypothetical protein